MFYRFRALDFTISDETEFIDMSELRKANKIGGKSAARRRVYSQPPGHRQYQILHPQAPRPRGGEAARLP